MTKRPFFVGVGAQRSGTTWIGHFLRKLPDVSFSPIKEINFFDSKFTEGREGAISARFNTRLAVLGLGNYARRRPLSGVRLWYHYAGMRGLKDKSYRAYFDELGRFGLAGEITPSYAMLDEAAVAHMDALLDQPNYFFIMRNPVDRLLSQFSFLSSRPGLATPVGKDLADALHALCDRSFHTNYGRSLATYRAVVPEERFRTIFTEHLFAPDRTQAEVDGLCDFLGIGHGKAEGGKAVNRAPSVEIDAALRAELATKLAPAYSAAAAENGGDLPLSWRDDLDLIGSG